MVEFNTDFFDEEWRGDYFVKKKIKKIWAAEIEVLAEVDRICKKHDITYFADSGTLLGAVRHKGFIPWDDDIDIVMKRKDYEKFLQVAPAELPEEWYVVNAETSSDWSEGFSRVMNGRRISFEKEYLKRFHGCPYMVGIDIFPLDKLAPEEERELILCILQVIYAAIYFVKTGNRQEAEEKLVWLEETCKVQFDRAGNLSKELCLYLDRICKLYEAESIKELVQAVWWGYCSTPFFYKSQWYEESIQMPFENLYIPVPKYYHEVLCVLYGNDYMTPKQGLSFHNEPFFIKQDIVIKETVQELGIDLEWLEDE